MKITLLTKEYPPYVYGGAGIHVEHLSRHLAAIDSGIHKINLLCFGDQNVQTCNLSIQGMRLEFEFPYKERGHKKFLDTLFRNLLMTGAVSETDIIHCHTWYTHLAGCLIKSIYNVPLIITTHSLEPQRPWKEEQLGSAYRASTWIEKTAFLNADGIIAVSMYMKKAIQDIYNVSSDRIRIIPNGIDVNEYKPLFDARLLTSYNINPEKPFILFVGRITRQKGIFYLLDAVKYFLPGIQIVLVAADPDTAEIGKEMAEKIKTLQAGDSGKIIWIDRFIPRDHLIIIYSHASVFVCPSIYEPYGIINLEAMACGTPVVASAVGGILETVVHEETGMLVSFEPIDNNNPEPKKPDRFSKDLADVINGLFRSPEKMKDMGLKARQHVKNYFSWERIARQTLEFYKELT